MVPFARGFWIAAAVVGLAPTEVALSQEISGPCSQVVGTFLTENALQKGGGNGTSRSLLVLTNGGHALRFDSDETGATMDQRPFGDSAGTWRCDGVDDDGTVRLTASMLDFTYPGSDGEQGQIARIDLSGSYIPTSQTMELKGKLGFLPMTASAQDADALSEAPESIAISLRGTRIKLPPAAP